MSRYWDELPPHRAQKESERMVKVRYKDDDGKIKTTIIPNWGLSQWLEGPKADQIIDYEYIDDKEE